MRLKNFSIETFENLISESGVSVTLPDVIAKLKFLSPNCSDAFTVEYFYNDLLTISRGFIYRANIFSVRLNLPISDILKLSNFLFVSELTPYN